MYKHGFQQGKTKQIIIPYHSGGNRFLHLTFLVALPNIVFIFSLEEISCQVLTFAHVLLFLTQDDISLIVYLKKQLDPEGRSSIHNLGQDSFHVQFNNSKELCSLAKQDAVLLDASVVFPLLFPQYYQSTDMCHL